VTIGLALHHRDGFFLSSSLTGSGLFVCGEGFYLAGTLAWEGFAVLVDMDAIGVLLTAEAAGFFGGVEHIDGRVLGLKFIVALQADVVFRAAHGRA
jgi:hypothetical protein